VTAFVLLLLMVMACAAVVVGCLLSAGEDDE
jgi:hypothetical protein